jgi:hypothetical protein
MSRVHLSLLFQSNLLFILVLLHAHADAVYFVVGRLAHDQASSFIITHLVILVIFSDPLLEGYRCNTFDSFFGEVLDLVHLHELFVERATRVACKC